MKVFGDVTVREQSDDMFAKDNGAVPDYNAINAAGGAIFAQYPDLSTPQRIAIGCACGRGSASRATFRPTLPPLSVWPPAR